MGPVVSAPNPAPPDAADQPSFARLHGEACWWCGAVTKDLQPAGEVRLDDEARTWPVVTCGNHPGRELP